MDAEMLLTECIFKGIRGNKPIIVCIWQRVVYGGNKKCNSSLLLKNLEMTYQRQYKYLRYMTKSTQTHATKPEEDYLASSQREPRPLRLSI